MSPRPAGCTRTGRAVGRTALGLAALLGAASPELSAQATPAGTTIASSAQATFQSANGVSYTVVSNTIVVTVGQVAGVDVGPSRSSIADPGNTVVFQHVLQNMGNGADSFAVAPHSARGWPTRVHRDANANGTLDAGDPLLGGPVALAMGANTPLLVAVDVPGLASVRGEADTIRVVASSRFAPTSTTGVTNQLAIRTVGIAVSLVKSVDRVSATPGDVLTYTIAYRASGPNSAANVRIVDPVPVGASYVPGTIRLNGAPLSDLAGDDAGVFDTGTNRIVVMLTSVAGGDAGTVSFQVRVGS